MVRFILFVYYGSIFVKISLLDLFHILHVVEGLELFKTEGTRFSERILACLKMGQNVSKCPDLSIRPLRQGLVLLPYIFAI